jgi:excisionase family DNA binding protein
MGYIDSKIQARIIEKKRRLDQHRPLNPSLLSKLRKEFTVEYTYDSNAIEGSTLTLHETRMVIEEGLAVQGRPLRDVMAARNHPDAINYVERLARSGDPLTEEHVLTLHRLTMERVDEGAGRYREAGVRIAGALFTPPKSVEVPAMMRGLLDWLDRNMEELSPVELAAVFHHRFVSIHPFAEGNGRTARLLMNLIMMRNSYPFIVSVSKQDRDKYNRALREADQGRLDDFVNYVARCAERTLDIYLNTIEEQDVLTLSEASQITSFSQEYLSLLARSGRLAAFKEGRNWRVSRRELERYLVEVKGKRS